MLSALRPTDPDNTAHYSLSVDGPASLPLSVVGRPLGPA